MRTYTNDAHPGQGFDPRSKSQQARMQDKKERNKDEEHDQLQSDDDNLDDGSGSTENPAVENTMD